MHRSSSTCTPLALVSPHQLATITKVFPQFAIYIMFPIGWMYYFGTNLENRFSVSDFWPKPESTYKIPFEKSEIQGELERLKKQRLDKRARRLEAEEGKGSEVGTKMEDNGKSRD